MIRTCTAVPDPKSGKGYEKLRFYYRGVRLKFVSFLIILVLIQL
jgi:hypothetical protein